MTSKIAISMPDSSLRKAKAAVKAGKAASVSNYIVRLIEDASARETFEEMIASWVGESGASEQEVAVARKESLAAFERVGLVGKGRRETIKKTG
jgi:hypothetical protein